MVKLILGDCLKSMKSLADNSVDAIVSDPPYGLSYMNKKWDYDVPKVEVWKECFRVLKPGGHLIAFAGSRTYHVMAMRVENAGFEIRDQLMWIYGQGFPKSFDISKGIDRAIGVDREVVGHRKETGQDFQSDKFLFQGKMIHPDVDVPRKKIEVTAAKTPAAKTPAAKKWEGWGTALKPAHEPAVLAQKPVSESSVELNMMKRGVGGLNIDACRLDPPIDHKKHLRGLKKPIKAKGEIPFELSNDPIEEGRWPANVIFDEEAAKELDRSQGDLPGEGVSKYFYCAKVSKNERNAGLDGLEKKHLADPKLARRGAFDSENSKKELNHHPTVKPIALMRYLISLVTPPGGVVLDPFMGSGSTGCAAVDAGFSFIGCELSEEYFEIAKRRIDHWSGRPKIKAKPKT